MCTLFASGPYTPPYFVLLIPVQRIIPLRLNGAKKLPRHCRPSFLRYGGSDVCGVWVWMREARSLFAAGCGYYLLTYITTFVDMHRSLTGIK